MTEPIGVVARLSHMWTLWGRTVRAGVRPSPGTLETAGVVAVALSALLAGCGQADARASVGAAVAGATASSPLTPTQRRLAAAVLKRYETAVRAAAPPALAVAGPLDRQVGIWELAVSQNKLALATGHLSEGANLSHTAPPAGTIRFSDGRTTTTPVLSPYDVFAQLIPAHPQECSGCRPVVVTGARAGTLTVDTSAGPAQVPAWDFTLAGTGVRLVRVAVPPSSLVQVAPSTPQTGGEPPVESAQVSPDGRVVTVTFTGSRGPATQRCGADYTATAVESGHAVVVVVNARRYTGPGPRACADVGYRRTASARLQAPLAGRAVLDLRGGLPVPVTPAP